MDRIAILELSEIGTRLLILESRNGRYNYLKENFDAFPIGEEIEREQLLKPATISKMISVFTTYREIIQAHSVEKIVGVASNLLTRARNQKGFFEELYNNIGVGFMIVSEEDCVKNIFNALNNSIDVSKACSVFVGTYNTYFIKYNRRTILSYYSIPFGTNNLGKVGDDINQLVEKVSAEIQNKMTFSIEESDILIGAGDAFVNFGRIAKKVGHYPLDLDNNYVFDKKLAADVFKFIKALDLEKIKKVKGMIGGPAQLISGVAIIEAVYNNTKANEVVVSTAKTIDGVVLANLNGEPQEKFTDLLGNSYDNYYEFHKNYFSNNLRVCNMAAILFKQLKVMHKLPRAYVKPMRIAAYMYDSGKSVGFENSEKHGFYTIINSNLCGASQKDLLLAGFICQCQNPDNFSLVEWMKYKDIVTDEDLDAVRKLGIIIRLASALNSSKRLSVTDVVCDILGDSIIMKTIVNGDASYDILQGMKVASDYRKIFKKNLQII